MRIMLEKAPKTLIRLSDPGPIEKSPLCTAVVFARPGCLYSSVMPHIVKP